MAQLQRIVISPEQLQGQAIALTSEQIHYLSRVLRLRVGDRFIAMNGQGQVWLAALTTAAAQILEPFGTQSELPLAITLLIAPPKGSGLEDIIRQATEIGVTTIQPVLTERTVLNPSIHKLERWQRIAQEAAEQSERRVVPQILAPISFQAGLEQYSGECCYCCVARREVPHLLNCLLELGDSLHAPASSHPSMIIATGPEGGWTDAEITAAIAAGFKLVSLGSRILRAVTAPVVALALIAAAFEAQAFAPKS